MIKTIQRFPLFSLERFWFCPDIIEAKSKCDVIRCLRMTSLPEKKSVRHVDVRYTLHTDLHESEELLQSSMKKNTVYEIRRCNKEKILYEYFDSEHIREDMTVLYDFYNAFKSFCDKNSLNDYKKTFSRFMFDSLISENALLISRAEFDEGGIYHIYAFDSNFTLLTYSVSDFKHDNVDKQKAGRINKYLHWRDMLFFKEKGLRYYDWGDLNSFENPNGIGLFKMSFGGKRVVLYNISIANTVWGKIILKCKSIIDCLKIWVVGKGS